MLSNYIYILLNSFLNFFSIIWTRVTNSFLTYYKEIITWIGIVFLFISVYLFWIIETDLLGFKWIITISFSNIDLYLGIDSISLVFIFLTTLVIPLCLIFNWYNDKQVLDHRFYFINILLLEVLIVFVFMVLDVLAFYILFELILIPFYVIVTLYQFKNYNNVFSSNRKMHAFFLLLFYTLFASLIMFTAIFLLYINTGTTNIILLWYCHLPFFLEKFLWWCFFISFSVKIPIIPFHLWLPEAHVESPTEGSVLLAALVLKVGAYGFIRILMPIFSNATLYYSLFVMVLSIISSIYTSMSAMVQIDIKRVIAYASIAHMNICILGLMSLDLEAICGSIILMFGHGLVSAGLFFCIGILYNRLHTKNLTNYSGIVFTMPYFSFLFFFFLISNFSFPGTINFIGEFLILFSFFKNKILFFYITFFFCIMLTTAYSIIFYNRVFFGLPKKSNWSKSKKDLFKNEFFILFSLLVLVIYFGLFPSFFINLIKDDVLFYFLFNF